MYRTLFGPGAVLLALTTGSVMASDTTRQLDAHEHGHAVLNVAIDANQLLIEFESPAVNIVGFEHEPKNDAQKDAIEQAEAVLANGNDVFMFSAAAGCSLADVEVEAPHEDHDDHAGEKEKHDDEKHAHEKEKHDDEKHADEEGESHSEFHVTWQFSCSNIASLKKIDVRLFELFPDTDEIDANIIGQSGQSASELTPDAAAISL